MSLNDVKISMDIAIVQPKSAIHTRIYPWKYPWIHPWMYPWIHPWISISTATLIVFFTQNGGTVFPIANLMADSDSGSPVSYSSFLVTIRLSRLVSEIIACD